MIPTTPRMPTRRGCTQRVSPLRSAPRGGCRRGDQWQECSLRGGDGRRIRPPRGRCAQGGDAHCGADSGCRRSGRVAGSWQARQPGRHGRPYPPAHDVGTRPLYRRQAPDTREPPHAALFSVSTQTRGSTSRIRSPGTGSPQHRSGAHPDPRRGVAISGLAVKSVRTT